MMNLTLLKPFLLADFRSESDLVRHIEKLSENFTSNRQSIEDYVESEKLISAYACFYLTTNYPKFSHVLSHLEGLSDDFKDCEWIDIGCGPGTFLYAIKDYYAGALKKPLWGIESSPLMRKQANRIIEGLYPYSDINIVQSASEIPVKKAKRIVLFSHSLNEMGNEKALSYLKQLDPDKILFIEPGTKEFFKQYLQLRDQLIALDFNCLYPCPSNRQCPMQDLDDWCHQYIKVKHDAEIERLTQLVSKNRKWLPLTLGLYAKNEFSGWVKSSARIIRTYPSTKFSFEWQVCHSSSDQNQIQHFQLMKRNIPKIKIKALEDVLAGKRVEFELDKDLGDNRIRIKLKE